METIETVAYCLNSKNLDAYELVEKNINKISVEVNKGKVEDFKISNEYQLTIRILKNKKIGFTYIATPKINKKEIENLIDSAISSLKVTDKDEYYTFFDTNESIKKTIINNEINNLDINKMIDFSTYIEESAYNFDKRIKIVKNSGVQKTYLEVKYINSYGAEKTYETNFIGSSVVTVAEANNESFMGYESLISKDLNINFKSIGENAANKAIRMFGAKKGSSMKAPIIFENELVCDLLSLMVSSFFLENIDKKKSLFFQNKIGDNVANKIFNLIDDGISENLNGSVPFDDEGVNTSKKYLLKKGTIVNFLNNQYYANKYNLLPTGNGFKPYFKSQPSISITNLILEKGNKSLSEAFKELKKGLYLTNLMGLHMANTISGDFSLGAEGILIENGELTNPIKEFVISGNLKDILLNTKEIYNNVKSSGVIYAPSILVEGLTISG